MTNLFRRWVAVLAAATCWQVPYPQVGFAGEATLRPFERGYSRVDHVRIIPPFVVNQVTRFGRQADEGKPHQLWGQLNKVSVSLTERPALSHVIPHRFIHSAEVTRMPTWSPEQLANARAIAQVGRQVGASSRDILIGIMTAMQESGLRNLSYGDRDSVGLFQQRNAWASRSERMDPNASARMFFLGGHQGQRGLLSFKQRDGWSLTQAAQKVQVSAFPDAYAKHENEARDILGSLGETNTNLLSGQDLSGAVEKTGPGQVVQQNGDLDLFAGAAGVASPNAPGASASSGTEAASAPGIESADIMPDMSQSATQLFDGMDATTPSGGSTFDELFPKQGTVGGSRERVGQLARQLLGTPYVWGGTDPDKGFDCSGFVQYVLRQVGFSLPRISADQARSGKISDLGQLNPGDLVGWNNSSRNNGADHIAIYLGNGQIVEAPRPGIGVRIRSLDTNEGAYGVALNY